MSKRLATWPAACVAVAAACAGAACAVGPRYARPDMQAPGAYREPLPSGWTAAQPGDTVSRGEWWQVFHDPDLDALERAATISNQNVLGAEAQYRAAKAAVRGARASLFPAVSLTPSVTSAGGAAVVHDGSQYQIPIDVSYEADVWGRVRGTVSASVAGAQRAAAELENVRLLYQSELAADYFQLQGVDADRRLLEAAVRSFEEYLQITQDRFQGGVVSMADVTLAQTQLEGARAELTDLESTRAQFEHAIAVLTGRPPSDVTVPPTSAQADLPTVPVGVPSALVERRPDIAAAERQVFAANRQIGVATAAFFPVLTLSGSGGAQALAIADLVTAPARLWSLGAQLATVLFDAGKRRAQVAVAEATYDATVADYRQTVLTGFQEVEDDLATIRTLDTESDVVSRGITAAQQSLDISTIQYRSGTANYLQVITAQSGLLQNQRTQAALRTRALLATVSLIQALGGGWDSSRLPTASDLGH